jgi:hypothetical protein
MSKNINDLLIIMGKELSVSTTNLGSVVIAVSFLEFISVFSILIVILRKRDKDELSENSPDKVSHDIEMRMK